MFGFNINRGVVEDGGSHLAGYHPFPDEIVEPELVGREVLPYRCRFPHNSCWTDRFVGFLSSLGNMGKGTGMRGHKSITVFVADILSGFNHSGTRHFCGIGAHICNEPDVSFFTHR